MNSKANNPNCNTAPAKEAVERNNQMPAKESVENHNILPAKEIGEPDEQSEGMI